MRHILIVDDDGNVLNAMQRTLKAEGKYSVWGCTSALEALVLAERKGFDLVISDYRMPEMDGVTFLQRFTALQPDAARLIVSGCSDRDALMGALNVARVYGYVEKPWNNDQLHGVVAEALKSRDLVTQASYLDLVVAKQNTVIENQTSIIDYIRRRHPDVLLGALANYDVMHAS